MFKWKASQSYDGLVTISCGNLIFKMIGDTIHGENLVEVLNKDLYTYRQQAETIASLQAENEVLSLRERELVEASDRKDDHYQSLRQVVKSFKLNRDELRAEIDNLQKVIADSKAYEAMMTDGSDDGTAPVCEGCLGQGTVLQMSDFDSDPIIPCPLCQHHASVESE